LALLPNGLDPCLGVCGLEAPNGLEPFLVDAFCCGPANPNGLEITFDDAPLPSPFGCGEKEPKGFDFCFCLSPFVFCFEFSLLPPEKALKGFAPPFLLVSCFAPLTFFLFPGAENPRNGLDSFLELPNLLSVGFLFDPPPVGDQAPNGLEFAVLVASGVEPAEDNPVCVAPGPPPFPRPVGKGDTEEVFETGLPLLNGFELPAPSPLGNGDDACVVDVFAFADVAATLSFESLL
jgi:hypothetical protein